MRLFGRSASLRALLVWIAGLVTLVPYGTYYLFVHAGRDQYALLITLLLFWVFGYWAVVGPILAALRVRAVMRTIEKARDPGALREALRSPETREAAIELIAGENHIPRFLAVKVVDLLAKKFDSGPDRPQD